jgi:hypothetical protein
MPEGDTLTVRVTARDRDAGSVGLFTGRLEDDGRECLFAAAKRVAQSIVDALEAGNGPVYASVESWKLLG